MPDPDLLTLNTMPREHVAAVLRIEATLRDAADLQEVLFVAVNEFQRVLDYDTATILLRKGGKLKVKAVTAVSEFDPRADLVQVVERLAAGFFAGDASPALELAASDAKVADWPASLPARALLVPLRRAGEEMGGMILFRHLPWQPADAILAGHLVGAAAFSAARFIPRRQSLHGFKHPKALPLAAFALIALSFVPVTQSVLASAEIVPIDPFVVTAPYGGVIKEILVASNSAVRSGQTLFRLDDTEIRGKYEIATRELEVTRAELLSARQLAFSNAKSKTEAEVLARRIDLREAERSYYGELMTRLTVTAENDGLVIMGDTDEWIGKPVSVGEKIMTIARPGETQLRAWLAVDDAIPLPADAPILFFMNVDPLNPIAANVRQMNYEAEMSREEVLTYRIRAEIREEDRPKARLGLKGTAKIYGEKVSLFYYLMRRPLAVIRRTLGL